MKRFAIFVLIALTACSNGRWFEDRTLRIDWFSIGDRIGEKAELISLTRTGEWSGPVNNLVDKAGLGDYRVIVTDPVTKEILYQKGFSTLFGEWRTTDEALKGNQSWYNTINVPMPRKPVRIDLEVLDRTVMCFDWMGGFDIDPKDVQDCRIRPNPYDEIFISGKPTDKVDLTFISEGYTEGEMEKYLGDVRRFTDALFACPPFDSHKQDFNVRAVSVPSDSSGVSHPSSGIRRKTALNASYDTFDTQRYLMTKDIDLVADATWNVPTDAVFILVNEAEYGGGGIYNFYAIGSSDNPRTLSVFLHEFGHSFGALADEYFSSATGYDVDSFYSLYAEPWEKNITTLVDFDSKWKDRPDSLYEGGGYRAKGIYRPANHCMMRDFAPFCPVCTRAIEYNIDFICDRNTEK